MSTDAPVRLKKELDKVLSLQSDIEVVEKALQATRTAINHDNTPPAALNALKTLEKSHADLLVNVEGLYASLNIHDTFPELRGMSLDFVRTLLIARDLKINIRKRAIASLFECDKLDRAVGGKANPLGMLFNFLPADSNSINICLRHQTSPADTKSHLQKGACTQERYSEVQQLL